MSLIFYQICFVCRFTAKYLKCIYFWVEKCKRPEKRNKIFNNKIKTKNVFKTHWLTIIVSMLFVCLTLGKTVNSLRSMLIFFIKSGQQFACDK